MQIIAPDDDRTAATLYISGLDLSPRRETHPILRKIQARVASNVGVLRYLMDSTRVDLAYVTSALARTTAAPTQRHWRKLVQIARYLRGTLHYSLHYGGAEQQLRAESDADFAGCQTTRKSTIRLIYLGDCLIRWKSKCIATVLTST